MPTCHWCHVMERESFEEEEVAEVLNQNFVSIKVDREERPDIDNIYMTFCQAITGQGGWPLTIVMTPEQKPFFAGTYFPKDSLIEVLEKIADLWKSKRQDIIQSGDRILKGLEAHFDGSFRDGPVSEEIFEDAYMQLKNNFDYEYGGFGIAPKFPSPHNLYFLLRYWKIKGTKDALNMVEKTLESMYKGGIFDHIGFGFSRYSTDRRWIVPHFEKMLYDNSLLAIAYLEAYQATRKRIYADTADKIFTYMTRDLLSPEGAFYSAEDADSEGVEGKFYLFTRDEILDILGEEDGELFCRYYNITNQGNFEGNNILNLLDDNVKREIHPKDIDMLRNKVFEYREERERPFRDDKILTGWNALAIAAFAMGARILDDERYVQYAQSAVEFILDKLVRDDGRLLARYREGQSSFPAYTDDYAYLIWALIELYQTTFNPYYLKKAIGFNDHMIEYFWDADQGGLFIYGKDSEKLIARPKEIYDGAVPSGNSVAAANFVKLANLTGRQDISDLAQKQIDAFASIVDSNPASYTYFLTALLMYKTPAAQVVISGNREQERVKQLKDVVNKIFIPNIAVHLYDQKSDDGRVLEKTVEYIEGKKTIGTIPAVYVCKDFSCRAPVTSPEELEKILN